MTLHMMHTQCRYSPPPGQCPRQGGTHHECPHQAGARRIGHTLDFACSTTGLRQHLLNQWQGLAHMVTRSQFRHHTTVFHVNIDLAEQGIRQQATLGVIQRNAGLIAGCFKAQN